MGRTSARFPLGPLRRHRGHEALTLSLLALLLSQTFLHPPLCPPRPRWQWRSHVQKPGQLGCLRPPPASPLPPPLSPRCWESAVPPLPPPHPRPRSAPPSHMRRRTGAHGWSGGARSIRNAIRAVQCRPSSRPWTFARPPRPPAPPPPPSPPPFLPLLPPPFPPLLPFCRRPLVGRRRSFANPRPRRPSPTCPYCRDPPCCAALSPLGGRLPVFPTLSRSDIVATSNNPPFMRPLSFYWCSFVSTIPFQWPRQECSWGYPRAWW